MAPAIRPAGFVWMTAVLLLQALAGCGGPTKFEVPVPAPTTVNETPQPPPLPPATVASGSSQPGLPNSIGMRMVYIRAGEFLMGSTDADKDADTDEKPQHRVRITRPFYLGATEVTRGQFARFVEDAKYRADSSWRSPGFEQTDEHPVVNVSWNDAAAFAEWLSRKEGATYRLPTEAEWEYACRAGSTTRYSFGDDPEGLAVVGNVNDGVDGARDGFKNTAPVGHYQPNAWGLYDMHGNVWEWCWDGYEGYNGTLVDDPRGAGGAAYRVIRGGSWYLYPRFARSAYRSRSAPADRGSSLGFRLARVQSVR